MSAYCPPGRVCVTPIGYPNNPAINNGAIYYGPGGPRQNGIYYGPGGPGPGPFYGGGWWGGGSFSEGRDGWWWGLFENRNAFYIRIAHGVLASLAFVVFFPVGAILLRIIPGRFAVWVHAATQVLGWLIFMIAASLAFWMLRNVQIPFRDLLNNAHAVIGIIIFALVLFQPFLGILHHASAKRNNGRRGLWSYIHVWLGRFLITIGIINGGLGIKWARNSNAAAIAYAIIGGIVWLIYAIVALSSEVLRFTRRGRKNRNAGGNGHGAQAPYGQRSMRQRQMGPEMRTRSASATPPPVGGEGGKRPVYS